MQGEASIYTVFSRLDLRGLFVNCFFGRGRGGLICSLDLSTPLGIDFAIARGGLHFGCLPPWRLFYLGWGRALII